MSGMCELSRIRSCALIGQDSTVENPGASMYSTNVNQNSAKNTPRIAPAATCAQLWYPRYTLHW